MIGLVDSTDVVDDGRCNTGVIVLLAVERSRRAAQTFLVGVIEEVQPQGLVTLETLFAIGVGSRNRADFGLVVECKGIIDELLFL